jgi:hypothetical protein
MAERDDHDHEPRIFDGVEDAIVPDADPEPATTAQGRRRPVTVDMTRLSDPRSELYIAGLAL